VQSDCVEMGLGRGVANRKGTGVTGSLLAPRLGRIMYCRGGPLGKGNKRQKTTQRKREVLTRGKFPVGGERTRGTQNDCKGNYERVCLIGQSGERHISQPLGEVKWDRHWINNLSQR